MKTIVAMSALAFFLIFVPLSARGIAACLVALLSVIFPWIGAGLMFLILSAGILVLVFKKRKPEPVPEYAVYRPTEPVFLVSCRCAFHDDRQKASHNNSIDEEKKS